VVGGELRAIDVENGSDAGLVLAILSGQRDRNTSDGANEFLSPDLNCSVINCGSIASDWLGRIQFDVESDAKDGTGSGIDEDVAVIAGGSAIGIVNLICTGKLVVPDKM